MGWALKNLKGLFDGVDLVGSSALSLKVIDVAIKGEAIINNRKNKLIPAYEIEVILSWAGSVKDGSGICLAEPRGRVVLPYIRYLIRSLSSLIVIAQCFCRPPPHPFPISSFSSVMRTTMRRPR